MKSFGAILATAIVSVILTLVVVRYRSTANATVSPNTAVSLRTPTEAWLTLKKQSAKLDAELRAATKTDAKNATEALQTLKAYDAYCNGEVDLFAREQAVYRNEHDSEESPILIEQSEATSAWCNRVKDLYSFMANPKNEYRVEGGEISAIDAETYNRLMLAFRVASIRLVNANAAEANEEARQ